MRVGMGLQDFAEAGESGTKWGKRLAARASA